MKQKRVMQIFLPSDANIFADLVTLPSSSQMPCWPVEIGALVWLANEVKVGTFLKIEIVSGEFIFSLQMFTL